MLVKSRSHILSSFLMIFWASPVVAINYVTLDVPGSTSTTAGGIYGNKVVGSFGDAQYVYHGYKYDGTAWTTFDEPHAGTLWGEGTLFRALLMDFTHSLLMAFATTVTHLQKSTIQAARGRASTEFTVVEWSALTAIPPEPVTGFYTTAQLGNHSTPLLRHMVHTYTESMQTRSLVPTRPWILGQLRHFGMTLLLTRMRISMEVLRRASKVLAWWDSMKIL